MSCNGKHPFWVNWDLYDNKSDAIHKEMYQLMRWLLCLANDGDLQLCKAIEDEGLICQERVIKNNLLLKVSNLETFTSKLKKTKHKLFVDIDDVKKLLY